MNTSTPTGRINVVYDSQCPICTHFACAIRDDAKVTLVDGRQASPLIQNINERGLDIDRGSVVYVDGNYLYGADAFQYLALHVKSKGLFGALCRHMFRHKFIARAVYPMFVFTRRTLLKILRRPLINADSKASQ
mgnify:CR=1 FL=1